MQTTKLTLRQTNPKEEKLLVKMNKRKKTGAQMVKTMKEMMIKLKKKNMLKKMLKIKWKMKMKAKKTSMVQRKG